MDTPIILAHGALGVWDELIFLAVVVIFLTMMGISWVKNRNSTPRLDSPPPSSDTQSEASDADRFRLD